MSVRTIFKAVLVLFSFVYLIFIVAGKMTSDTKLGPSEYALIAFTVLFVADFFDKLAEISFGKEGFKVRLKEMENRQSNLEDIMAAIQISLKGIVTKYEYKHLINLEEAEYYPCTFGYIFFEEIKRLDSIGFIEPAPKVSKDEGFNIIINRHEHDKNPFDLKEYMRTTEEGKAYIHLRRIIRIEDYWQTQRSSEGA